MRMMCPIYPPQEGSYFSNYKKVLRAASLPFQPDPEAQRHVTRAEFAEICRLGLKDDAINPARGLLPLGRRTHTTAAGRCQHGNMSRSHKGKKRHKSIYHRQQRLRGARLLISNAAAGWKIALSEW